MVPYINIDAETMSPLVFVLDNGCEVYKIEFSHLVFRSLMLCY